MSVSINGKMKIREDGWANVFTGQGKTATDRSVSTTFNPVTLLARGTLTNLFSDDGIGKKIITKPVDDMTREWITIEGDSDGVILDRMKEIKFEKNITESLLWGSLYGGAVLLMGIDDGQDFEEPLNENAIKKISFLKPFDRHHTSEYSYYEDKNSEKFSETEVYELYPVKGLSFKVHESRILRFEGAVAPDDIKPSVDYWGLSDLQAVYDRLRGIGETYQNVEHIVSEFVIGMLKISNLQELIASGQEDLVKKRLNLIDLSKHILNTILIDENEEFTRVSSSVTGLSDLVTKMEQAVSAVADIPQTILFGSSPKGMNATGESDVRQYYDRIASLQKKRMLDQINRVIEIILLEKETGIKGINDWQVLFNPLWQPTEKEIAETQNIQAKTDDLYINNSVLKESEVRESRFGGSSYSSDTQIEPGPVMPAEDVNPDNEE